MKTAFRGSGTPAHGVRGGGRGRGVSQAVQAGLCLAVAAVLLGAPVRADVPVTITYTADNIVGAWWQNGGAPVPQTAPNPNNWTNWEVADTATLSLAPGHSYSFIWRVRNLDTPVNSGNPAAFLAQITVGLTEPTADWPALKYVTHSEAGSPSLPGIWQYAVASGPDPTDFNKLTWLAVAEQTDGGNGQEAWYGGSNIWATKTGLAAFGTDPIADRARWIWSPVNIPGQDGYLPEIYIRFLVPEPGAGSMLGLSLLLLLRRRRRARAA